MALQTSQVAGPTDRPLIREVIGHRLRFTARTYPDRPALVVRDQEVSWTWAELDARVDALASGLLGLGLARGDRVAVWAPNCAEWVLTQLATARIGVILVTINPAYRIAELEHALKLSGARALVVAEAFKTNLLAQILLDLAPEIGVGGRSPKLPALEHVLGVGEAGLRPGFTPFDELAGAIVDKVALAAADADLAVDQPINIQFTSGTTGAPKGATLTHLNILNNGAEVGRGLILTPQDRICIPVPLYHCFGMVMGVLACVAHGSAMVFPSAVFEPAAALETVQTERCTALYGVPTMFVAMLENRHFADFDLSSLRTGIMAGSPCPIEVMKRVIGEMHMRDVTICYGMTETSPVSFQTLPDADLETRVSTVGVIHPHLEAKVVAEDGAVVPLGETGELLVRGYSVMQGYWNDPQRTAEAIDTEGWMHTGDLATVDARGRARIVGRAKDMIIRGGENIYPAEIEAFLYTHPAVADVAVFGVPDARYGEEVCAWVQLRAPVEPGELQDFCRASLAAYKTPRHVQVVETFPMTVTGKVQKFVMREQMREILGRAEIETA